SFMIATEQLTDQQWETVGLAERETFSDYRHRIIYGQRTAAGHLTLGGRGAPYHFKSRVQPGFDQAPAMVAALRNELVSLLPQLGDVAITHAWGGPLGVARDWCPSVGLDLVTGIAWAGGYVGQGVAASNLAGRTLADLLLSRESELVRLPWVGYRSRTWE